MPKYRDFLPELKSMTLFQSIEDEPLIALLEAMAPELVRREKGTRGMPPIDLDRGIFCVVLKGKPLDPVSYTHLDVYKRQEFLVALARETM